MSAPGLGLKNLRQHLVLIPTLYGLKLILALLFTLPLLALVSDKISHSVYPTSLVSDWDLGTIRELMASNEGLAPSFMVMFFSFLLAAFFLKQFLNGGIYSSLLSDHRQSLATFLGESAGQFLSNLRISILIIPIYLILAIVGLLLGSLIPADLLGHFGSAAAISWLLRLVVMGAFLLVGIVLSESLRLHRAASPDTHGSERLRITLDFLRGHGVRLYGYYLVWLAPYVVIWVVVEWLALLITGSLNNFVGVLGEMVLFQLCAGSRTTQSLLFTATAAPIMASFVTAYVPPQTPETETA